MRKEPLLSRKDTFITNKNRRQPLWFETIHRRRYPYRFPWNYTNKSKHYQRNHSVPHQPISAKSSAYTCGITLSMRRRRNAILWSSNEQWKGDAGWLQASGCSHCVYRRTCWIKSENWRRRNTDLLQIILSSCCCSIWKQMLPVPNSRKRTLPALVSVSGASGKTSPHSTKAPVFRT